MYRLSKIVPIPFKRCVVTAFNALGLEVRIRRQPPKPLLTEPEWTEVQAGPLRGMSLFLFPSERAFRTGSYDEFLYQALGEQGITLTGAVVWDVGAHIGYHTLGLSALVGSRGRVVAFEPDPRNLERIQQHLGANPVAAERVEVKAVALANTKGQQVFRYCPNERRSDLGYLESSGIPSDRFPRELYDGFERVIVPVTTVDDLLAEGCLPPALIKIDVEGAECLVLEGAQETLTSLKPVLMLEVHSIQSMFYVERLLLESGYDLRLIEDPNRRSSSRTFLLATPQTSTKSDLKR